MAFKIKDGLRIGTVDVINSSGAIVVPVSNLNGGNSTTLKGSIPYQSDTNTTTQLPPNTTTTKKFLSQIGDGTNGAVPAWSTVTSSDVGIIIGTNVQAWDADLDAIAALAGTTGYLKKTAANTWLLDTSIFLTAEADTLATVTGRGATTTTAVSITNATSSTSTSTGALIVIGGVGIGGDIHVGGNAVFTGNLTVNGTTTTINSTTVSVDDIIFMLGGDTAPGADDNLDRGIEFRWHNGSVAKLGFFGFDDSTGKFTFIPDATDSSGVLSGTVGEIDAKIDWSNINNKPVSNTVQATLSTVSTTAVATFASTTYRSAKYLVQITQGTSYQVSEILVIHNGTTTFMTEYGVIETNTSLGTFTSDINGGNVRLLVTMASATSATINIDVTYIVV